MKHSILDLKILIAAALKFLSLFFTYTVNRTGLTYNPAAFLHIFLSFLLPLLPPSSHLLSLSVSSSLPKKKKILYFYSPLVALLHSPLLGWHIKTSPLDRSQINTLCSISSTKCNSDPAIMTRYAGTKQNTHSEKERPPRSTKRFNIRGTAVNIVGVLLEALKKHTEIMMLMAISSPRFLFFFFFFLNFPTHLRWRDVKGASC